MNILCYEDFRTKAFWYLFFEAFQGEPVLFSWSRQVTKQHHSAGKPKGALDIPDCLHMLAHFSFGWKCSWAVLCTSSNCLGALLTVWIAAGINGVCRTIAGMCMGWLWWATFRSCHTSPHLDTALHITQSHCIHCCTGGRGGSRCRQLGRRLQVCFFFFAGVPLMLINSSDCSLPLQMHPHGKIRQGKAVFWECPGCSWAAESFPAGSCLFNQR